jgi:hypothetical protein
VFGHSRDPYGRFTGLASGIACLVLAGMLALVGYWGMLVGAALALAGVGLIVRWWLGRRAERYDLKRLWEPEPEPEEPWEDTVPADEEGSAYCGWCDEANPVGVRRCVRCGRELG